MIPVLGFATVGKEHLASKLVRSIDYPVEHLIIVDNGGHNSYWPPENENIKNLWVMPMPFGLGLVGAWNLIVKSTPYAPYWVLINDDAWFEPGALQTIAESARPDALGHPQVNPQWTAIVLGEQVVEKVGLYDERFYPLYFDDNDYDRRCEAAGIQTYPIPAKIHHINSASINHQYNATSYANNQRLFLDKTERNDNSWTWTLQTRRANRWD